MNTTTSTRNLPEEPARRGFVRAAVGGGLLALAGLPGARATAPAATSCSAEPGLPFHAWASAPPMVWNSCDAFGASVTEADA